MARDIERTVFDKDACQRIGQLIGRAALVGSEYSYPASLGPRISIYHIPGRDPSQSSQCSTEANPS